MTSASGQGGELGRDWLGHVEIEKRYVLPCLRGIPLGTQPEEFGPYLEGRGNYLSGFIMGITGVPIWLIRLIKLLTKSP